MDISLFAAEQLHEDLTVVEMVPRYADRRMNQERAGIGGDDSNGVGGLFYKGPFVGLLPYAGREFLNIYQIKRPAMSE